MREKLTRGFLWISVLAWGFLIGAKLFDLRVLVGAWSASPPASLQLLPYGPQWPVDTGEFFIPSSAALLVATFGALVAGWRTPWRYRVWLAISAAAILATLVLTVTQFWPRNAALWAIAQGRAGALADRDAIVALVRTWVALDWVRIAMGTLGFVAAVKAISVPFPPLESPRPASLAARIGYAAALLAVVAFVAYFVSQV